MVGVVNAAQPQQPFFNMALSKSRKANPTLVCVEMPSGDHLVNIHKLGEMFGGRNDRWVKTNIDVQPIPVGEERLYFLGTVERHLRKLECEANGSPESES